MRFEPKFAVITGASSGIGAAFARACAKVGAQIVITGRRDTVLRGQRDALLELGARRVDVITGDLADENVVSRLVSVIAERPVDLLVNNAGFGHYAPLADARLEPLVDMLRVHAEVPLRLAHAAIGRMVARGSGVLVNVGSLAGRAAVPGSAVYVASKIYLERLSESLAIETAPHGVVVQALTPGYVRTDFHRDVDDIEKLQRNRGIVRWMDADEVVAASVRAIERARLRYERRPGVLPRRRDVVVVPGWTNRLLGALAPFVPRTLVYRAAATRAPR
ncbi:MAG: SDR family NAD(P)-dependent oxidoreductase [Spirochaetota bacterium]